MVMAVWMVPARRALALAVGSAMLAACTVGPDYVRPTLDVPAGFAQAGAAPLGAAPAADDARTPGTGQPPAGAGPSVGARPASSVADAAFWESFGDPLLTRLVDDALVANHDLRIALASYDQANALLRGARLDRWPTVTAQASASDLRASADQQPGIERAQRDGESYSAGITASWELDLFGRVRRSVEAERARTDASASDLAAAQVAIAGEVASGYFELRGLQEQLRVARDNADNQRQTLQLVQARLDAGRDSAFDTSRARAQLEATLATVPQLEAQVAQRMHRLAVLTGRTPEALIGQLQTAGPLPTLPPRLDAGTPGELLRRRPDVAAAEGRLHAATARIGVATADLFPRFTLGGLIGTQAFDSSALFERSSETRLVALGVDWSFLDIGRVRARIAAADARAAGELARYEQTVLLALEDTENALVSQARARVEDAHRTEAATQSAEAARLARVRFEAGTTGLFEVLDAERTRLEAEDALAQARTRSATSVVALYRAMAGGWPSRVPERVGVR